MGSLDFLSPGGLDYPGSGAGQVQCGTPYAPHDPDGFWNQIFTPKELPYPVPPCEIKEYGTIPQMAIAYAQVPAPVAAPSFTPAPAPSSAPAPSAAPLVPLAVPGPQVAGPIAPASADAPSATPVAASAVPAPAPQSSPVTVVVNVPAPAASAPVTTPTATPAIAPAASPQPSAADLPVPVPPPVAEAVTFTRLDGVSANGGAPSDKIVTAYATNPRLRARQPKAHEEYLDEILDEKFHVRMLTKDATPVVFTVPDGFNAVDFYQGAIEVNPPHGSDDDRDEIVTAGELSITGASKGSLEPGDEITVVVPWRHASWVELAPDHLRLPVVARFYNVNA